MDRVLRCLLVTDFNPGNLAGYLANDEDSPSIEPFTGDFGQIIPVLTQPTSAAWRDQPDFVVVWSQPERVIPSFQRLLEHQSASLRDIITEVDTFAAAIIQAAERVKAVWVCSWVLDPDRRGLGMSDLRPGGVAHALVQMNARLTENLGKAPNVFLLDSQRWITRAGPQAFAPKLWYQAKVPFGNLVFQEAVADIKAAIRGLLGQARKLVIVDLDDTFWGGIVGDLGWENLRVGGHDPVGEAFADFQRGLKALMRRGVLLGIVSKNDSALALAALREHPEMILRESDFAGKRINWEDKAANVVSLANELNLGLQSVVFIDDNPVERARVREALPEVLVPEWPENPQLFPNALARLRCFDTPTTSTEDSRRTEMYAADRHRSDSKTAVSLDDWLTTLKTVVEVAPLSAANLSRAVQLLNKTNQMNLRTRRMTESELKRWTEESDHYLWAFRVTDKFGDSGITGLASLEMSGGTARIADFVLSCRVMGRKIEATMIHWLVQSARKLNSGRGEASVQLVAEFAPTPKNNPCLEFWQQSGFTSDDARTFVWQLADDYPAPQGIELVAIT